MKCESSAVKKVGPDLFSAGSTRRDAGTVKILSDLDPAAARVDPNSDVVGSRAAMLLFFAVVIPAVFTLALWHREQTEALEVRMSPTRAEHQPVVVPEARGAQKDAIAGNSAGDAGAPDGAARIVSSPEPPSSETAMRQKEASTSVSSRALSSASAASRDARVLHAADHSQHPAANSTAAVSAEQGRYRPPTRAQAAATQGPNAGAATRSSEHSAPAGPVAVAAEFDNIQRDLEIITAIVKASSR